MRVKWLLGVVLALTACAKPVCAEEERTVDVRYGASYLTLLAVVDGYRAEGWDCDYVGAIRDGRGLAIGETFRCTRCR